MNDAVTCTLPQVLTLLPVSSSGCGSVNVSVNGNFIKEIAVSPGCKSDVQIEAKYFVPGMNMLTLTRVDAGVAPITFDTFYIGGSWIAGRYSTANDVFPSEYTENTTTELYACGDWHWLKRALTSSWPTSRKFFVPIEKRLADKGYAFRYRHYVVAPGGEQIKIDVLLNGTKIQEKVALTAGEFGCMLPSELVQDGINEIECRLFWKRSCATSERFQRSICAFHSTDCLRASRR